MKAKLSSLAVFLLVLGCTKDVTFDARVAQARAFEESDALDGYFEVYWRTIEAEANAALERCFPDKTPYGHATLVADLLPNRTLANIQVKPNDHMTQCFANAFAAAPFPAPPPSLGSKNLPIRAEISLNGPSAAP